MEVECFAELVINIEAPLAGTFHYHVPADLLALLEVGHLVEVEFGRQMAQGIVIALTSEQPLVNESPIDTKPVIAIVDPDPVVQLWQIELARWISRRYLTPLNACLRLMLPPGLTRWADVLLDVNPAWDGSGSLTDAQQALLGLLREKGELRGRQIKRALPKVDWRSAMTQLVRRDILRRASILEAPRARPREVRTAELSAGWRRIGEVALELGRRSKEAELLHYLAQSPDPLPVEATVMEATGVKTEHLNKLVEAGLITRLPGQTIIVPVNETAKPVLPDRVALLARLPAPLEALSEIDQELVSCLASEGVLRHETQPATVSLAIPARSALEHILRLQRAESYYHILRKLAREAQPVDLGEIYRETGASLQHLRRLERLGLVRLASEEVWRDSLADRDFAPADPPRLTVDQARVWGRIKVAMLSQELEEEEESGGAEEIGQLQLGDEVDEPVKPFLVHGVTGSGKTEIYMRAIDLALERGQQAIVLVPEIALTPQTVRRFAARFPGRVAVLHSRLSDGERYDTWRRARQRLFDIVIGPRSALFTPLPDLGVIVIDEEHDASYKQTPPVPPPYYHARDVAIALGKLVGATVIMGSATPDVVTYHRAQGGRYQLLELPRRIMGHRERIQSQAERLQLSSRYVPLEELGDGEMNNEQTPGNSSQFTIDSEAVTIPLPPIQVVDLRQELRAGNRSIFSRALDQAISETLERNEQVILFLNRRGTSTYVFCRDCGHVLRCPRCELPLTYHRPRLMLVCHQCGRKEPSREECPNCGSRRIRHFGLGTEQVEELVQQRWPQARITRWDRDTTVGRDSHEALLAGFINRQADVLIGTQMIAKGLDLPFVTLVGVISADVSLGLPDYRTSERTFQLLAQVAGRAGRGLLGGRVIIQTYQPEHYAIQAAAEHDFAAFYVEEIRFRTQQGLPPFRRMARLLLADPVNERGEKEAKELARNLQLHLRQQELASTELFGPVPPFFSRVDGRYRWQLLLRSPDPNRVLGGFHLPQPWVVDIDPVSIL
jgi:primosomal protein N' (replication factor Y)